MHHIHYTKGHNSDHPSTYLCVVSIRVKKSKIGCTCIFKYKYKSICISQFKVQFCIYILKYQVVIAVVQYELYKYHTHIHKHTLYIYIHTYIHIIHVYTLYIRVPDFRPLYAILHSARWSEQPLYVYVYIYSK